MLIRAALLAWVEWIISRSSKYPKPRESAGLFFCVYFSVRLLILILLLIPLRPERTTLSYLALGDSYTIGESVPPEDRYPAQVMRALCAQGYSCGEQPDIIATTGWTTGDLLRAMATDKPATGYQAVSLLIGVNNQYQGRSQEEYRMEFTELLKQAVELAGHKPAHVLVLSIPDYSVTPFAQSRDTAYIARQIDSFNLINSRISAEYHVNYLDVTAESRKAVADRSLIAGDGLHFSGKEYGIWASLMMPVLKEMFK
jgi:lysophospholipase L1-like esterase